MYFVEKTKGYDYFKLFDYYLLAAVLILSGIGIVVLSSAVNSNPSHDSIILKQAVSLGLGIVLALIISMMDYKDFKNIGIIIYFISTILLVVVLIIGTGKEQWGAKSWLVVPVVGSFQPSELAKIGTVIVISIFFERIYEGQYVKKDLVKLIIYISIPLGLVLMQPDAGTAMVFMFAFIIMVFICRIPYKYVFGTIGAFIASIPILWMVVLRDHQKKRIITFLYPESDPLGDGFQVVRSKLAIGSGRIFGKGIKQGIQTQNNGVPIKESDFIFTVIGEELGFIGAIAVLIIIYFILMRCIYIAKNSRDAYGSFLVIGLTSMMAFHFIENIGMCIGVLPVTGIPLPFVSLGGSAMVTNYIGIGIILSVSMRRKKPIFNSSQ